MISSDEISEIGSIQKPHGIKGEVQAEIESGIDVSDLRCIILDTEGIYVPFFITGVRRKSSDSVLLTIDGIENEQQAKQLNGKTLYALNSDLGELVDDSEDDGYLYASDLLGYQLVDDRRRLIGEIVDYDDRTENVVLIVKTPDEKELYVPFADEFFIDINPETKTVVMALPEGLTDL